MKLNNILRSLKKNKAFTCCLLFCLAISICLSLYALNPKTQNMLIMFNTVKDIYDGLIMSDTEYIIEKAGILKEKTDLHIYLYQEEPEKAKLFESASKRAKNIQDFARDRRVGRISDELNAIMKESCIKCHIEYRDVE